MFNINTLSMVRQRPTSMRLLHPKITQCVLSHSQVGGSEKGFFVVPAWTRMLFLADADGSSSSSSSMCNTLSMVRQRPTSTMKLLHRKITQSITSILMFAHVSHSQPGDWKSVGQRWFLDLEVEKEKGFFVGGSHDNTLDGESISEDFLSLRSHSNLAGDPRQWRFYIQK